MRGFWGEQESKSRREGERVGGREGAGGQAGKERKRAGKRKSSHILRRQEGKRNSK